MENNAPRILRFDSRFRVSGTSTDFEYQLPESIQLPEGTQAQVSAVSLPYAWWNVDQPNNVLYVVETDGTTTWRRRILLVSGQYTSLTLPGLLQNALNAGTNLAPLAYNVSYQSAQGSMLIQLQGADVGQRRFRLPSEDELMSPAWKASEWDVSGAPGPPYDLWDPRSVGDLLRLPAASSFTSAMQTGLLDVGPQHVLYLHSSLGTYDMLGPKDGDRDVIARIPVDVSYGYVVHYRHSTIESNTFGVGSTNLRNLRFRLTNSKGAVIDLHGGHMSIEIVFVEPELYK